jgi:four helix bundle protein
MMSQRFDLEYRLIDFAILAGQLVRSGCSPAMNYGEAQSAESRNDFIHKMKIILKELRESMVSLKLIEKRGIDKSGKLLSAKDECNQLISIFMKIYH